MLLRGIMRTPAVLSVSVAITNGPAGSVTTPAFTGTAESVTGTEQVVKGRIEVKTTTTSMATEKLQVSTSGRKPPLQPVVASTPDARTPAPGPAPARSPALRRKELSCTDSELPLGAAAGLSLLAVSAASRCVIAGRGTRSRRTIED